LQITGGVGLTTFLSAKTQGGVHLLVEGYE